MKHPYRTLILIVLIAVMAFAAVWYLRTKSESNSLNSVSPLTPAPKSARVEPEPSADTDAADTEEDDDPSCIFAKPKPALKPDTKKYRYRVKRNGYNLEETVSQKNGVRLVVVQGGCVHFLVISFEFSLPANEFPKLPKQQLTWIRSRLKEFNCVGYRCNMADNAIDRIRKHINKLKNGSSNEISVNRLVICHDDVVQNEAPACEMENGKLSCIDDCSWDTGGSTRFEVKQDGKGKVKVILLEAIRA